MHKNYRSSTSDLISSCVMWTSSDVYGTEFIMSNISPGGGGVERYNKYEIMRDLKYEIMRD